MSYPLAYIIWVDSWFLDQGWTDVQDLDMDDQEIHSTGFLVEETETAYILSPTWVPNDSDMIMSPLAIPKVCVIKAEIKDNKQEEQDG